MCFWQVFVWDLRSLLMSKDRTFTGQQPICSWENLWFPVKILRFSCRNQSIENDPTGQKWGNFFWFREMIKQQIFCHEVIHSEWQIQGRKGEDERGKQNMEISGVIYLLKIGNLTVVQNTRVVPGRACNDPSTSSHERLPVFPSRPSETLDS